MINGVYYQIEVLLLNEHLFATNTSDYQYTNQQIRDLKALFIDKFPASEGYSIVVTAIRATASNDSLTGTAIN